MSEHVPSIGIDFGTTNSSVAWYDPRTTDAEIILNAEGQPKTPSLVHFDDNETLVGEPVENLIQDVSTDEARRDEVFRRTIVSIKRNLLSPPRIALPGGRFVRPVDVSAEILKKLKRDAEEGHFHEEVRRAVITCPAEFNVLQRQKIEEAGRLAGFSEVALLEEPVAGALAYAQAGLDVGKHVLVYDLGGGTFDLAVLDNEDESFHVAMEPKGMERCGGDDFDLALYHHCDEVARESLGRPISLTGSVDLSFLRACRRRKESLTFQERGRFSNYLVSDNGPVLFEYEVDRRTFEGLIGEYIETTTRLTEEILKQAASAGQEVDTVVLIGGSVRVPLVVQTLRETLPVSPLGFNKRDVAVALGAAYYANIRWGESPPPRSQKIDTTISVARTQIDQYRRAVEETFSGKKLGRVEVDRLNAYAGQLGLDREQTADVERQILGNSKEGLLFQHYRQALAMVWKDEKLNGLEVEWLNALAGELGLNQHQISYAESEIMGDAKEVILDRQEPGPEPGGGPEGFSLAHTLTGHSDEVHSVAFSPDGQFIASGASDHYIRGWNARTGQPVGALPGHVGRISSVTFSPDGELLASGGSDKTIRVWKLPNGEPFHMLNHLDWIFSVVFSPDGKNLVSGGADKEIKVWNLETGEVLRTLAGHSHWVLSLAISPDGRFLVSSGADKTVKVWNLETGLLLHTFEQPSWIRSVAVDPGGRLVAGVGEDGMVRVWDLENGELLYAAAGHAGPALSVVVSPDGQLLISGGFDGKIKTWNLRTGEPLDVLSGHPGGIGSIALSFDGHLLASGGHDGTVKIWEKEGAEEPNLRGPKKDKPAGRSSKLASFAQGLRPKSDRPENLPE